MNFMKVQQNSAISKNAKLMKTLLVLFLSQFLSYQVVHAENYCALSPIHIACHNNGNFAKSCSPDRAIFRMGRAQIQNILKLHNERRNTIALGKIRGYDPAAKMPVLRWNSELAYLAEMNAKTCEFEHDKCRETRKYPLSGQNIAIRGNSKAYEEAGSSIQKMVDDWFGEYKDTSMNYIRKYPKQKTKKMIGHFTVMVNDKNTAVGCALSRFRSDGFKQSYLVCNYGYTNVIGEQVYKSGRPASECRNKSSFYKGLCA